MIPELLHLQKLASNAVSYEKITRRSGGTCDYYVDSARLLFDADLLATAASQMLDLAFEHNVTHVGGEETSGLPLVGAILTLSIIQGRPLGGFMIRKEKKSYGKFNLIEGNLPQQSRVMLVDDVSGMGTSADRCCRILHAEGIEIAAFVTIVDRSENARNVLNSHNVKFIPLLNIEDIQ